MSQKILAELKAAVVEGNVKKARRLAEQVAERGTLADTALDMLMKAMKVADERYKRKEYFVADVASSASAMREAFKVLQPHIEVESVMTKGTVVIGSLKGNIQSLGKDIVAATLQSAGFNVVNLGVDIDPEDFVKAAVREKAGVVAVSISMDETTPHLRKLMNALKREGLGGQVKVLIGGNAVSEKTRREYRADAYAVDARDALQKTIELVARKPCKADELPPRV